MKLSIAIADTKALASAFVVFRGFEKFIPKAAQLGYDGVELALKRVDEINEAKLATLLSENSIEVSCISTGQVYADSGLRLTHPKKASRDEVISIFKEFIDLAETYGKLVNIGRVRGAIGDRNRGDVEDLFIEVITELCEYADPKGVTLILEPVNRYECDFINTVEEGVALLNKVQASNLKLLPDVFHMNIEEDKIGKSIIQNIDHIKYLHFADSNRLAPGQGHTDFKEIFDSIQSSGYDGWISLEILPRPNPEVAAKQAIDFLLPLMKQYEAYNLTHGK
ncbi:MAG: sugar phosphate isomerase/epimerase [Cyclobacteriaceae bacterium]|nr:sugar phosphate isomerase/epimerase [Cyclobacteriaceae bacterium]